MSELLAQIPVELREEVQLGAEEHLRRLVERGRRLAPGEAELCIERYYGSWLAFRQRQANLKESDIAAQEARSRAQTIAALLKKAQEANKIEIFNPSNGLTAIIEERARAGDPIPLTVVWEIDHGQNELDRIHEIEELIKQGYRKGIARIDVFADTHAMMNGRNTIEKWDDLAEMIRKTNDTSEIVMLSSVYDLHNLQLPTAWQTNPVSDEAKQVVIGKPLFINVAERSNPNPQRTAERAAQEYVTMCLNERRAVAETAGGGLLAVKGVRSFAGKLQPRTIPTIFYR